MTSVCCYELWTDMDDEGRKETRKGRNGEIRRK
jgi:hypothetical protein